MQSSHIFAIVLSILLIVVAVLVYIYWDKIVPTSKDEKKEVPGEPTITDIQAD